MREPFDKPTLKLLPDSAITEKAFRKKVIREITEAEERRRSKIMAGLAPKVSTKTIPETDSSQSFKEYNNLKNIRENEFIHGGSFLVARKIYKSEIWLKHPFYLKTWLWILGQANHKDQTKNGRTYKRGELITTYDEIIKGVAYYFNRKHIVPTLKQVRIILKWLVSEGMITLQPLHKNTIERPTRADPRADLKPLTRAYLGIRIIVINYDTYQELKNYKGTPSKENKDTPSVQQGHNNKNDTRKEDNIYAQKFLSFWKLYPHKVAKKKAQEAWIKLEKIEEMTILLPVILDAIENQKKAKEIQKAKAEFVSEWPYPATWLNGRRWEDEIEIKKRWDHATG